MNVINLIKNQIEQISKFEKSIFLDSILLHLERAEYYYKLGENDTDYYNDVVYRTNQAFEGGLKEAYKILTNKNQAEAVNETPYKIEKYFENNGVFKDRVLELFRNYRNEWRNKSTHDFKLFFDSNEAFIAINNVSSFTYLLMKQIIEKITFDIEQEKIKSSGKSVVETKKEGLRFAVGLYEIITQLLTDTIDFSHFTDEKLFEAGITGFLKANFEGYLPFIKVIDEPKLGRHLRPDFLIELGDERLILEVKRFTKSLNKESAISQLLAYLRHSGITEGILLAINSENSFEEFNIEEFKINLDDNNFRLRVIHN